MSSTSVTNSLSDYTTAIVKKEPICYNMIVALGSFLISGKKFRMGKNLKGKEIGKGICQRKDGLYTARFVG